MTTRENGAAASRTARDPASPGQENPATAPEGRSSTRSRAFWVIADQAVSSLANAGLTIVLARTISPTDYGAFALAFTIYSLVLSLSQSVNGEVVVIRYSGSRRSEHVRASSAAAGGAVLVGLVCALVAVAVALTSDEPLRAVLLTVGVLLPGFVLQDCWRTVFISRGTPVQAFLNDTSWIVLQAVGIGTLLLLGVDTVLPFVAVWGGAAVLSALVGVAQNRSAPTLRTARWWFTGHREVSTPSLANSLATMGSTQIAFVLIAALGAVEDVGAMRAAQTLLGPLNIIGFAASAFAVPEIVRRRLSPGGLVRAAAGISLLLVVVDLCWGAVLLLLPERAGVFLLGETWPSARAVLPWLIAFICLVSAATGAGAVMRALNRSNLLLRASIVLGPLIVGLAAAGVLLDGATGAAIGFAVAAGLVIPVTWLLMVQAIRLGRREVDAEPPSTADLDHTAAGGGSTRVPAR
ncbi:oligosaccharide flippase family protein [Modestobacter muralis]|uniref:Oligosaccharide flippase family protein n=1 Tax=Modestobacter muralis TaxID=1608614 RepID=A0A6P0H6N8_9ACTN|nr:oligosaccharide flippase family protein [Modestobacter muralis]NEK94493.1 oligosaccharide flippase family protein [Modestobacter muralis]NEN51381.1 oligosaccharide flippase family protein [Modestobacter muralis]